MNGYFDMGREDYARGIKHNPFKAKPEPAAMWQRGWNFAKQCADGRHFTIKEV